MPICPRCGKCLSSEQALSYHLNRKYKCGYWHCNKCKEIFNTKFNLQMHELRCLNTGTEYIPSTEVLTKIYNKLPIGIVQLDDQKNVISYSKKCEEFVMTKDITLEDISKNKLLTLDYLDYNTLIIMQNKII